MVKCKECNKKLGMLKGYHHPALGKRFLICGKCYTKVAEDMIRWNKFCLSDPLNVGSSKINIQGEWNKTLSNNLPLQKWFSNLWGELK